MVRPQTTVYYSSITDLLPIYYGSITALLQLMCDTEPETAALLVPFSVPLAIAYAAEIALLGPHTWVCMGSLTKQNAAYHVKKALDAPRRFIDGNLRFRQANVLDDERVPAFMRRTTLMMTDTLPIPIPKPKTQAERQRHWCHYHRKQCVKLLVVISHEDLVLFVGRAHMGSKSDKTILHEDLSEFPHAAQHDFMWADTAFSATPHVICKFEKPLTQRERNFNAIAQITRTRIERFFAFVHNNFQYVKYTRVSPSMIAKTFSFICDVNNFRLLLEKPSLTIDIPFLSCPCSRSHQEERDRKAHTEDVIPNAN